MFDDAWVASVWPPLYDYALGAPTGAAVLNASGVWSRQFRSAAGLTNVTFSLKTNSGQIQWAGLPPPPPPLPPLGSCPSSELGDTGMAGHEISYHTAPSAGSCCAACASNHQCVTWTMYTDGSNECHLHSSAAGQHSATGRLSGVIRRSPPLNNKNK